MALKVTKVTPINKIPNQPVTASQTAINQSDKLLALESKIRFLENDSLSMKKIISSIIAPALEPVANNTFTYEVLDNNTYYVVKFIEVEFDALGNPIENKMTASFTLPKPKDKVIVQDDTKN
ncbi:MAG: hypothetical protein IKT40_12665 [Bacilli bacterium]|nr:hypothetical protein [Bacilli bacterium]